MSLIMIPFEQLKLPFFASKKFKCQVVAATAVLPSCARAASTKRLDQIVSSCLENSRASMGMR